MNLLVLEASETPRQLHASLASAARQDSPDLTILLIHREGHELPTAIVDSVKRTTSATIATIQLREDDGLGSLLRLVRKRYKSAENISVMFADEQIDNPHAVRLLTNSLTEKTVYAVAGWRARDHSAQRNGETESGALPTFRANRIDGLAVASLDALDASEGSGRRAILASSLIREDDGRYVNEILVLRDVASVQVEYAEAAAPVSATVTTQSTATQAPQTPAPEPAPPAQESSPSELEDEPLLAHALGEAPASISKAEGRAQLAPEPKQKPASQPAAETSFSGGGIDEDVSDLLRGLSGDSGSTDAPDLAPPTGATPGFGGESLDDEAKALLTELAEEGRLDFSELEASLSKDDPDAIAFVAKLANIPADLRGRLRKLFAEAGRDPAELDDNPKTLSIDDANTDGLDDETRALLEAAIDGPANLSWQDEVVDEGPSQSKAAAEEPDEAALGAALKSLQNLEQRIDAQEEEEEDDAPSALDGWFEDFEREEEGISSPAPAAPSKPAPKPKPQPIDVEVDLEPASSATNKAKGSGDAEYDQIVERAHSIAAQIGENLLVLQQPNGEFHETERYAKECAATLWQQLDATQYKSAIQRAVDACRRRAESLALENRDDGQGALRAYALSAIGQEDESRTHLDDSRSVDTLAEALMRSRRGQVFDLKRVNHVRRALDSNGTLFDRWIPEDPNASPLGARDQAFAALLAGELAMRNAATPELMKFARKIEDRLLAIARSGATKGMFVAAAAFRAAARRGDKAGMTAVLDRFENSNWSGDGSSAADGFCESLAFLGLHLVTELAATQAAES